MRAETHDDRPRRDRERIAGAEEPRRDREESRREEPRREEARREEPVASDSDRAAEAPAPARAKRGKNGVVAAPAPDGNREFWETWAEEKTTRAEAPREERAREERAPREDRAPREERSRDDRPAREEGHREAREPRRERDDRGDRGGRDRDRGHRARREDRPERSERSEREPARSSAPAVDPGSLVRLYVSLGKEAGLAADDVRALLGRDLGDDAARIGSVALRATHAYVRVPEDLVSRIVEAVNGTEHNGTEVKVELARG